jgi:hypothetical protein
MNAYQTQNFALAVTLATCGVPFYTEDGGNPVLNIYKPDTLRNKYGTRYRGMELEAAVRKAVEDGNPGEVTYCFQRTADLDRIIKAYNEQMQAIEGADPTKATSPNGELASMEPDEAARFGAQWSHNRKKLAQAWKGAQPMIAVPGNSRTETQGSKTVTVGSMKLMSLNASPETREKLRL